ncbi:MAG: FMN-binding protein [Bacteroidales bacterium]|nr:FMN-binding protein [Bacteroidales bacterium]
MKNFFLGTAVAVTLLSICLVGSSCGTRSKSAKAPHDTLVVNTTEIGKDIQGYKGTTPLEITLVDGIVTEIKALPNEETPGFFQRVIDSGLLNAAVGKSAHEAATQSYDAVTGATFSSKAVIDNIRAGLRSLEKE